MLQKLAVETAHTGGGIRPSERWQMYGSPRAAEEFDDDGLHPKHRGYSGRGGARTGYAGGYDTYGDPDEDFLKR